ncbi:response regulator transcription factor [Chryseobacterium daecheongense]|uniref:DNA-binding response regulator n=1 Tax=Chryseobacterium daecheongense TaxID=192389 RepID=A0A3N0W5A2_9FLAO|nr:response regulator transcription factor [Chryseobacterium daecheongense]ROI00247.1 DNA-binding response regulator [Chryseobacterium daecheongense]TDX94795.1 LuxR family two component transcriptional regulator [Chryseobacterium daecheongense]
MKGKILIADDHTVVHLGTKAVIQSEYPDITVDWATDYDSVKKCLLTDNYNLILLDINMPGTTHTEMIPEIKHLQSDIRILIFTGYDHDIALQYIKKGAEGYLNKQCGEEEIKNAIKTIFKTGYYYPPEFIPILLNNKEKNIVHKLTAREFEIFELLAKGNGNLEISNILNIQITTISTFKKKIFQKLGVKNVVELSKIYEHIH